MIKFICYPSSVFATANDRLHTQSLNDANVSGTDSNKPKITKSTFNCSSTLHLQTIKPYTIKSFNFPPSTFNYLTLVLILTLTTTSLHAQTFGQNWFHPDKTEQHICDETCAPKAYTEEEWENKQREMEEIVACRSDEIERTDEWFNEEDLLEPFIMNAYITYYRELHDLLPNGPADSIALQEALIQNLHAINEVFYNTGMTPTPETPVFNVVGIESVP